MQRIIVLDFGAQYSQLIARRVRECNVYCEIKPYNIQINYLQNPEIKGIILSGGPSSVYQNNAPQIKKDLLEIGIPILGICYGMQLITSIYNGTVNKGKKCEYGLAEIFINNTNEIFTDIPNKSKVWMSHGDSVENIPSGFIKLAETKNTDYAAIANLNKKIFGVQFHPEVTHTQYGKKIIENFIFKICKCEKNWDIEKFLKQKLDEIKAIVSGKKVTCAVSGGVDSTVMAKFLHQVIGDRLECFFINNGLLRKDEKEEVLQNFAKLNIKVNYIDASDNFLRKLKGIIDPEKKRQIIGREFIKIFFKSAGKIEFLAQGTLYPDVIESVSVFGPSAKIKTHHNRVKEVLNLIKQGKVIEPFCELFKDEVRELGKKLQIPDEILWRFPFPGPGLAIRILGEVTEKRLSILRQADAILQSEIKNFFKPQDIWQAFIVLLPVKSVGVMGDERTYDNVAVIRAVTSIDGMTADWARFPYELLEKISNRIINEVQGINRVVFDISSKPPSTIEWE